MAERRMFAKTIIDSDAFLEMPMSSQALYFHLAMRADDDGFINNPKKIQRVVGASEDDLKVLIAKNFILNNEGYDRSFYAGFAGYENENESEFFVNLRCAKIYSNKINLYVGGGIMPDSIPENEWKETELKSRTIGDLLILNT